MTRLFKHKNVGGCIVEVPIEPGTTSLEEHEMFEAFKKKLNHVKYHINENPKVGESFDYWCQGLANLWWEQMNEGKANDTR